MADINLLSNDDAKKNGAAGAPKAPKDDEMALHVPDAEPEPPAKPAGGNLSAPPAPKPAPQAPASLLSQKIEPISTPPAPKPQAPPPSVRVILPLPPKPAPRPSPPPPKPPTPPSPPPPPMPEDKDGGRTLRVSLITTGAGAGLSEVALMRRLRGFAMFGLLGLVLDGAIFGGLAYQKHSVEQRNSTVEQQVMDVDAQIAQRELELAPVREFQQLTLTEAEVLQNHAHWTGALKLLEDDAMPQVQFGSLSGADTGNLSFQMTARDYATLAKQIVAFRQDPRIISATADTASAEFGENGLLTGVHSEMHLAVDPKIFRFTPQK